MRSLKHSAENAKDNRTLLVFSSSSWLQKIKIAKESKYPLATANVSEKVSQRRKTVTKLNGGHSLVRKQKFFDKNKNLFHVRMNNFVES